MNYEPGEYVWAQGHRGDWGPVRIVSKSTDSTYFVTLPTGGRLPWPAKMLSRTQPCDVFTNAKDAFEAAGVES
jgi:hypothetical protein